MKKIAPEAEFSAEQLKNISALARECGLCELTVKILYGRGVDTAEKIQAFLHPSRSRFIDPFKMSGMSPAVELIKTARDEGWSVAVYGDYDADGVCASTIMYKALAEYGIDVCAFVPERRNGYGLNRQAIDEIFEEYCPELFITVDCGISDAAEVEYIKEQGAEIIVTDHHELPEVLPDCISINPKFSDDYPYDNLCGAGVAFKVACALLCERAYSLLDFAAIATVADSVPLTGENRDIVAEGLKLINSRARKNYADFINKPGERVTAQTLAFAVAPKINAAGRMGDANAALKLFLSEDEGEIYDYSVKLTAYNLERQKYCDELYLSAKAKIREKGADGRVIVLWDENWNAGFVGIVAARIAEEYCRPTMLFVKNGDMLKGSARSVDGVNIFEALKACSGDIAEFGGHSQAAGVNVELDKLSSLEKHLDEYLHANYSQDAFTPTYYVNGTFTSPASAKLVKELDLLEPFGVGNRKPQFVIEASECQARAVKPESPHLAVRCNGLDLIYFSGSKQAKILSSGVPKSLIFDYNISVFRGKEQIKGYLRDVIYRSDGYSFAEGEAKLNGVSVSALPQVDCTAEDISRGEVQRMLDKKGEYGTVFIACDPSTLAKFDIGEWEVNIFSLSAGSLSDVIILSPQADCDLSGYENVVYLDDPVRITLPSLAGKRVRVCREISGVKYLRSLSTDRESLISVYKYAGAGAFNVGSSDLAEAAKNADCGCEPMQTLFALKVFEQLGLIEFSQGRISVARGQKTQLTNSDFYNFICSVKD